MQNQLGATNTSNIIGGVNATMVQVPATKTQSQYYTVDMSSQPHKLVNVQRPSNPYITIQHGSAATLFQTNNNGQPQYVRIQLPTAQHTSNFVNLPGNQNQSLNNIQDSFVNKSDVAQQRLVPLPANLINNSQVQNLNQQKISIQLVQQPNQTQTSVNPRGQIGNKSVHLKPNMVHISDGVQIRPLLLSPQKPNSLVGTVSVAQPTQMLQIADLVQQQKQTTTPQFTFIQASPGKKQPAANVTVPITSSSLFQAFQQAAHSTPLNTQIVTRFPTSNVQTVLTTLNPHQVDIQPCLQQHQQHQNSTLSNQHGTTLLYGANTSKIDDSSTAYQGTVMMFNANQVPGKRQVLAPKMTETATQPTQMFVPITMSNNVSVFTNHTSLLPNKQMGQMGHPTTLRIQQQIAPRASSSIPATSTTTINNTVSQQKIFIPIQSSVEQQQYIIQSLPQNILQINSQLNGKNQNIHQQRDTPEVPTSIKPPKSAATSFVSSIADSKPTKKPCNCTKSQCLKLYCECFANGEFCNNCNCRLCRNSIAHEVERSKAIKACLERNPYAFHPKIGKGKVKGDNERRHTKGCNCKRSGCLKNYCECYEAKILCSSLCKCSGCKNFEESSDRQTLMHLADAAEVRVLQQNAAKTKFAAQMDITQNKASKEKLPFTFMTTDVSKATCDVLLASVQEAEVLKLSPEETEKSVLEEFSRCLNQIIEKSKKAKQDKR